jgi:hypothetical protein
MTFIEAVGEPNQADGRPIAQKGSGGGSVDPSSSASGR